MTKTIRIENACNSDWKVNIEVWEETPEHKLILVDTYTLDSPTLLKETYITSTRHLVIKEFGPGSKSRLKTL